LQRGIETDVHYPVPPHLQRAYQSLGLSRGQFPVTEKICETILSLPLWPGMQHQRADEVIACVKKFFHR
jgi:dTDP-4-amino-4,6-dideoxygalactose transaminase